MSADAGVALGPVGAGAEAATRDALNKAYYGKEVSPTDILVRRAVSNKHAAGLIGAVSKAAGK